METIPTEAIVTVLIVCLVIFFLVIKGVIKTFKRAPIVAILCIIFLLPIYLIWAFVELFTGSIDQKRDKAKMDRIQDENVKLKENVIIEKPQIETKVIVKKPKQESDSIENKLEKLEDLKTKGIITEEEYEEKKKEIIDKF